MMRIRFLNTSILAGIGLLAGACANHKPFVMEQGVDNKDTARVIIYRPDNPYHRFNPESPFLYVDDMYVGKLANKSERSINLMEGKHYRFTFKKGRTYYIEYSELDSEFRLTKGFSQEMFSREAYNLLSEAGQAELDGEYLLAEKKYEQAELFTDHFSLKERDYGVIIYNLGRIYGYRCKREEAEKLLLESIAIEEDIVPPNKEMLTPRLFEIARFYLDNEDYKKSSQYFERAFLYGERIKIEDVDPIAVANTYQEYSRALFHAGDIEKSKFISNKGKELRKRYPDRKENFIPVKYNSVCD
jgi:tetratricopeptide (TPR) repeat protein